MSEKLLNETIKPAINTSPLIFLSKGDFLQFLQIVSPEIIVPQAVASEIQAYGETDITATALAKTSWLVVTEIPPVPAIIQSWDLGAGESAVLTWAYVNPGTEVIIRPVRKFRKKSVSGFEDVFMSARLDVIMRARDSYC